MIVGSTGAGLVLGIREVEQTPQRASLLLGPRLFLGANEARVIVELRAHTMVDRALGVGIGVAAVLGQLATLLHLDPDPSRSHDEPKSIALGVFCEIESGEGILLVGGSVLATGLFPMADDQAISFQSERIEIFSVASFYRKIETSIWERRALTPLARPPASRRSEGRSP